MSRSPSLQARSTVEFSSICSDTAVENWRHKWARHNTVRPVRRGETPLFSVFFSPSCRSVWIWFSAAASGSESQLAAPRRSSVPLRRSATPVYKLRHRRHFVSVRAAARGVIFFYHSIRLTPDDFGCSFRFSLFVQHQQPLLASLL